MARLQLSIALVDYFDRTRPILDGTVTAEGIDLVPISSPPSELFRRTTQHAEFDISEMSMSTYMIISSRGDDRFVGIPVFPSRVFRHAWVFVNEDAAISCPEDLRGKRVGVFEYQMTAALWQRSFLQHDYGVTADQIEWFEGGLNVRNVPERYPIELPKEVRIQRIRADETLSELLEQGRLDAVIGAQEPQSFRTSPKVKQLFPNYKEVEQDYYRRTGFFPIMHTVVIRRDIYEAHGWVAVSMYRAFERAKKLGFERLGHAGGPSCALPWLLDSLHEIEEVFGPNYWPYGIEDNRAILEHMTQASFEQGLSQRKLSLEELFAPETMGLVPL